MDTKGIVVGVLAGATLGFAIAWVAKPEPDPKQNIPSRPRESADRPAERPTGPKPMYTGPDLDARFEAGKAEARKTAKEEAEKEVAKEREEQAAKVKSLESQVEALKKEVDEAKKAATVETPKPEPKTGKDPLVRFGKHADQKEIREANYEDAADANLKIKAALERVLKAQAEGKEPEPADLQELGNQNVRLQELAYKILKKLPTHSPGNGEYTHPLNIANLIAQALKAAGKPLSDEQVARIADLGNTYEAEWEKAQARYNENTLRLEKLTDEVDLKQQFYDGLVAQLAADQREIIVSPQTHNRLRLDFYSPGLMLQGNVAPLFLTTREALRTELIKLCAKAWHLEQSQVEGQAVVFDAWFNDLGELLNPIPEGDAENFYTPDCIKFARAQIKAMYELIAALRLDKEAAKPMRGDGHFYVLRVIQPK